MLHARHAAESHGEPSLAFFDDAKIGVARALALGVVEYSVGDRRKIVDLILWTSHLRTPSNS